MLRTVASDSTDLHLRIVVTAPPDMGGAAEYGLQAKDGSLRDGRWNGHGSVTFDLAVRASMSPGRPNPNFLGAFTHGPPTARHLYLSYRAPGTAPPAWTSRMKVPLAAITWDLIASAGGRGLEATIERLAWGTVPIQWRSR